MAYRALLGDAAVAAPVRGDEHMMLRWGPAAHRWFAVALGAAVMMVLTTVGGAPAMAAEGGSIGGTVSSDAPGYNPEEVVVAAYALEGDEWVEAGYAWLDDDGHYTVEDLPPDDYRLEFFDFSWTTVPEYWDDVVDFEEAADITVGPGQIVLDKDAELAASGTLVNTRPPGINGTPSVGSMLTVDSGDWSPAAPEFFYEWLSNGQEIAGAESAAFVPSASHSNTFIAVRITAWLPGYRPDVRIVPAGYVALGSPTGLGVNATAAGAVFTWNAVPGATTYRLMMQGRTRSINVDTSGRTSQQILGTLEPSTTYTASVRAEGSGRASAPSTVTFTTPPLPRVTGLRTYERKARKSGISWTAAEGAKRYEIRYWSKGKKPKTVRSVNRGRSLNGLKPNTTYSVRVTAYSADDLSRSVSKTWSFKTRKK